MKIKRMGAVFFLVVCVFCGCGKHEISHEKNGQNVSEEYRRAMEKAETTPYGAYPELVTYTLAQISGANNSNLPEGNTYEHSQLSPSTKLSLRLTAPKAKNLYR